MWKERPETTPGSHHGVAGSTKGICPNYMRTVSLLPPTLVQNDHLFVNCFCEKALIVLHLMEKFETDTFFALSWMHINTAQFWKPQLFGWRFRVRVYVRFWHHNTSHAGEKATAVLSCVAFWERFQRRRCSYCNCFSFSKGKVDVYVYSFRWGEYFENL